MFKYALLIIPLFSLLTLTGCGGGGSNSASEKNTTEADANSTSYTESTKSLEYRTFTFETPKTDSFIDIYTDYVYEFKLESSAQIELSTESSVYGYYDVPGKNAEVYYPTFSIVDVDGYVKSTVAGKTADFYGRWSGYGATKQSVNLTPGIYYVYAEIPSWVRVSYSDIGVINAELSKLQGNDYTFTVKKQLTDTSIQGTQAADLIRGFDSDQTIFGDAGNDTIYGEKGNDIIDGGAGNDILNGGLGVDVLTGGAGMDVFSYELTDESGSNILSRDTIADFVSGEDFIDFSKMVLVDTNGQTSPIVMNASSLTIGQKPASTNSAVIWFIDGVLYGKFSSNSVIEPEFSIELTGVTTLSASDFIFN